MSVSNRCQRTMAKFLISFKLLWKDFEENVIKNLITILVSVILGRLWLMFLTIDTSVVPKFKYTLKRPILKF